MGDGSIDDMYSMLRMDSNDEKGEAPEDSNLELGTPKTVESFENQVGAEQSKYMKEIFLEDENLKKGFEDFLKYSKMEDIEESKQELSKCENKEDVKKFIENHQGCKIGSDIMREVEQTNETIKEKDETIKETDEGKDQTTAQKEGFSDIVKFQEKVKEALQNRDELLKSHLDQEKAEKLDKDTRKKAEEFKNKLPEETKKQLVEKYGDNAINDYILLRVTLNEVKNDSSFDASAVKNFESKVNELSSMDIFLKNIDNECKIADTRLSSFSSENIGQTRTELFAEGIGNESLRNARNNNVDLSSHKKAYEKMFPEEMGEDAIFVKYGQFLEGDLKKYWEQYKDNYKGFMDNLYNIREQKSQGKELTPEEENILKIPGMLKGIKENFDESAKNMIEEMCLITQVNAMAKCIGQEGFGLNKANDIKYDETGAMVLDGHIDGVDFSVRHNFNEERAPLQTSSKLIESADGNTLEFGVNGKQKFKDSPFKLPSQESIFGMVSDFVSSTNFSGERFNSVEDYIDNMQEGIVGKMDDVFDKDAEVANDYMQNEIKGEKIVDGSLGLIKHIKPSIDFTKVINRNDGTERKMFDFMKILSYNIENSTPEEKNKLDWSINEIRKITDNYKSNEKSSELYSESISKYLENDKWLDTSPEKEGIDTKQNETSTVDENENLEKQDQRLGLIFDMFIDFNKNPTDKSREGNEGNYGTPLHMIVNDLYRELHDKPKEKRVQQVHDEETEKEQSTAVDILDLNNPNYWPPE